MNKKLLYLDIDGVLLGKNNPYAIGVDLAKHTKEFLEFCLQNYECSWLSTHCQQGDTTNLIAWLEQHADNTVMELARSIKPTSWKTLKTEAIDLSSDFYWIDDEPLCCEIEILKNNNVFDRWIEVNTRKHPEDLKRAMYILQEKIK